MVEEIPKDPLQPQKQRETSIPQTKKPSVPQPGKEGDGVQMAGGSLGGGGGLTAPTTGAGGHMVPYLVPNAAGGFQYMYGAPFQQMMGGIGGGVGGANMQVPVQTVIAQPVTGGVGGANMQVPV